MVQDDEAALAVAQQEQRPVGLNAADEVEKGPQVLPILLEAADVAAGAGRAAIAPHVKGIGGIAAGHEPIHDVAIAPTVLAKAMNDGQGRPGGALRAPTLVVQLDAPIPVKRAFEMLHPYCTTFARRDQDRRACQDNLVPCPADLHALAGAQGLAQQRREGGINVLALEPNEGAGVDIIVLVAAVLFFELGL